MTEKQKLKYMIDSLFSSKVHHLDILYDLELLINARLKLFQNSIDEFEKYRAEEFLQKIAEFTQAYREREFINRMYVISGVQCVSFAAVQLSDKAMKNIIADLFTELRFSDPLPVEETEPNLVSTIYMFHEEDVVFTKHVYPAYAALILQVLSSKNIVDYSVKKRWNVKD